ncbi:hypothetical protein CYMTET_26187 [Cymbomonas tetramitiformis]|uniref:Uncharacterized protein n=1 Tax=Cymbomonas tetramitiformis TaxID=36881 RepID=A0AAE0FT03_9CHLO|nr:hypothetical protein CYMTET_26187 [Cymbomonas tetramitiformis]
MNFEVRNGTAIIAQESSDGPTPPQDASPAATPTMTKPTSKFVRRNPNVGFSLTHKDKPGSSTDPPLQLNDSLQSRNEQGSRGARMTVLHMNEVKAAPSWGSDRDAHGGSSNAHGGHSLKAYSPPSRPQPHTLPRKKVPSIYGITDPTKYLGVEKRFGRNLASPALLVPPLAKEKLQIIDNGAAEDLLSVTPNPSHSARLPERLDTHESGLSPLLSERQHSNHFGGKTKEPVVPSAGLGAIITKKHSKKLLSHGLPFTQHTVDDVMSAARETVSSRMGASSGLLWHSRCESARRRTMGTGSPRTIASRSADQAPMGVKHPFCLPAGDDENDGGTRFIMEDWLTSFDPQEFNSQNLYLEAKLQEGLRLTSVLGRPHRVRTSMCCHIFDLLVYVMPPNPQKMLLQQIKQELFASIFYDPNNVLMSMPADAKYPAHLFMDSRPYFVQLQVRNGMYAKLEKELEDERYQQQRLHLQHNMHTRSMKRMMEAWQGPFLGIFFRLPPPETLRPPSLLSRSGTFHRPRSPARGCRGPGGRRPPGALCEAVALVSRRWLLRALAAQPAGCGACVHGAMRRAPSPGGFVAPSRGGHGHVPGMQDACIRD